MRKALKTSIPTRALPARFRRERVLVIGCGDVGLRVVRQFARSTPAAPRWLALTSQARRRDALRTAGITPLLGDLDDASSLRRLAALPTRVVFLAPPPAQGLHDPRSKAYVRQALRGLRGLRGSRGLRGLRGLRGTHEAPAAPQQKRLRSLVYVSTTGVYGDCRGEWVSETRPVAPRNARAVRRVDAERHMRQLARRRVAVAVLRAPGIYAADRAGSPQQRLQNATPVLCAADDVYTNHIHADDLARACWLALWRVRGLRTFNTNDDGVFKTGDFYDRAADLLGLPRLPRITLAEAERTLSEARMSFLRESRRLSNTRIKKELRLQWRYPVFGVEIGARR